MLFGLSGIVLVAILATIIFVALLLRRVVPTNEVHIVQSSKATTSYGKDTGHGNAYYEWPSWLPMIGVTKVVLPVSVFKLELESYDAYDTGRVPFEVDVVAFFRVEDSNIAAQRVSSFNELQDQLLFIVRGAVRTILAAHDIDDIMSQRSTFGEAFTKEINIQLKEWGVTPVKNIELMDIRDTGDNKVVHNIMEKKKSLIDMQSRTEVATNQKAASIAEIEAQREVDVQRQDAEQQVGLRKAAKEQAVGIATEQSTQAVKEQAKITKQKEMEVLRVQQVTQAEIDKNVYVVKAEQDKQTTILDAEGRLEGKRRDAEGISVEGLAKADAERALQMVPVETQIKLAKEIGENQPYQSYLLSVRQIEATQSIGIEQAKALVGANLKIIANGGDVQSGFKNLGDLLNSKGGLQVGSMLEGLSQTEAGKAIVDKLTG